MQGHDEYKTPDQEAKDSAKMLAIVVCFLSAAGMVACIVLALLFGGCSATDAGHYRKVGFRELQRSYAALPAHAGLDETITVTVTVRIVGDRSKFDWPVAAAHGSPVLGYATRGNYIWVLGKMVNGRIVVNQAVLGHELNHILQYANPKVHNPDLLDDIGA